jgi:hypothetical protein
LSIDPSKRRIKEWGRLSRSSVIHHGRVQREEEEKEEKKEEKKKKKKKLKHRVFPCGPPP